MAHHRHADDRQGERGYAEAIAWVDEHSPGPRVVVGLEGTRSYGIGLARMLQAAGLTVVEIERPRRGERRRYLTIFGGYMEVHDDQVTVLADIAETAEEIDRPRAEAARDRAEQRLRDIHAHDIDFERARAALMRAMLRLQVATHRGA